MAEVQNPGNCGFSPGARGFSLSRGPAFRSAPFRPRAQPQQPSRPPRAGHQADARPTACRWAASARTAPDVADPRVAQVIRFSATCNIVRQQILRPGAACWTLGMITASYGPSPPPCLAAQLAQAGPRGDVVMRRHVRARRNRLPGWWNILRRVGFRSWVFHWPIASGGVDAGVSARTRPSGMAGLCAGDMRPGARQPIDGASKARAGAPRHAVHGHRRTPSAAPVRAGALAARSPAAPIAAKAMAASSTVRVKRPDRVERRRQRTTVPPSGSAIVRRLEPHQVVPRRRDPDRSAGVRADGQRREPERHRRRRPGRRAAGTVSGSLMQGGLR